MPGRVARALLAWYAREKRDLPWRRTKDPYRIWVSEAMLQQTRVDTVIPYYGRFLARFPTLKALALANREDVLKAWEGLGYYRRAVNLHEGARAVLARHGGRFPEDPEAVLALPGIGAYTAGAIRSIALGQDAPLVDGNVARVLSRLEALPSPDPKDLWRLAGELLPSGRAGDFNQALMELGALVCIPRQPACPACPIRAACKARIRGLTGRIPAPRPRKALPLRREAVAVLRRGEQVLLRRRPEGALLGGLWEFPSVPVADGKDPTPLLEALFQRRGLRADPESDLGTFRHAFTHFRLEASARIYRAKGRGREVRDRRWVDAATLDELPVTRMTRRIHDAWRGQLLARLPLFDAAV